MDLPHPLFPVRYSPSAYNVPPGLRDVAQATQDKSDFSHFMARTLCLTRRYGEYADEGEFTHFFSRFGRLERVTFLKESRRKSRGFITFGSVTDANYALFATSGVLRYPSGEWTVEQACHSNIHLLFDELTRTAAEDSFRRNQSPSPQFLAHNPPDFAPVQGGYRVSPQFLLECLGSSKPAGNKPTSHGMPHAGSSNDLLLAGQDNSENVSAAVKNAEAEAARAHAKIIDSKLPQYLYPGQSRDAQLELFGHKLEMEPEYTDAEGDELFGKPPSFSFNCGNDDCAACKDLFEPPPAATITLENRITGELKQVLAHAVRDYVGIWSPWHAIH